MILAYSTQRLDVIELTSLTSAEQIDAFAQELSDILTPAVVSYLPPFFARVRDRESARDLLENMLKQSRVYCLCSRANRELMGLMFASIDTQHSTNIGYLLAEQFWRQGVTTELMTAFVEQYAPQQQWQTLIAGVDKGNEASIKLLNNLGFTLQEIPQEVSQEVTQQGAHLTEHFYIYNVVHE
ncbi:GNAT family N-acetyltransferase [Pseudoalteromonas pernae]|uniref:GNAT family N-acetyltransferase n=1 Tax=Pseudoalteromonas pernae TaxID=3118054 RepID=UPI003242CFC9